MLLCYLKHIACCVIGEKDLILLGMISCSTNVSDQTVRSKRQDNKKRDHQRTSYSFEAQPVCRETFKFMHAYVYWYV